MRQRAARSLSRKKRKKNLPLAPSQREVFFRGGGDVYSLKYLLGHSSLKMVEHYLHLTGTDASNAHRKASPADNWRL
jgi:hypothetical protein